MRSESLIPLDRVHPPSRDTREVDHIEIDRQIAEYLASGGEIRQVQTSDNATFNEPIIRNRKDQVEWARRHNKIVTKRIDRPA